MREQQIYADRSSALKRIRRRRKAERRKKLRAFFSELLAGMLLGAILGAMFIFMFITEEPYATELPEHYGQVEYCGQWFDIDDYNAMMREREAYLAAERAEDQEFLDMLEKIREEEGQ